MNKKAISCLIAASILFSSGIPAATAESYQWWDKIKDESTEGEQEKTESDGKEETPAEKPKKTNAVKKNKVLLDPSYTNLGNAVFISYDYPGKKYDISVSYYTPDGKKHTLKPQGKDFALIDGLENEKTYNVKINITDGKNKFSEKLSVKTKAVPDCLISMKKVTQSSLSLSWKNFAPGHTYVIYRKNGNGWVKLGSTQKASFTDSGLKSGAKYAYKLAVDCGKNDGSDVTAEKEAAFYTTPNKGVTASADIEKGILKWSAAAGASGYYVYYMTVDGRYQKIKTVGAGSTSCSIEKGKKYMYAIAPYYTNSDNSKTVGVMSMPEIFDPKLSVKDVSADIEKGVLKWNAASGADGYYIYYKTSGGKYINYKTVSGNVTSCAIDKGKRYMYAVAPYYINSDRSKTVGAMMLPVVYDSKWSAANASADIEKGELKWTAASGADGYYVYYKTVGGKYAGYRTVKGNITSCAIDKGKRYTYAVAPYYINSDKSKTVGAMIISSVYDPKWSVENVTADIEKGELKWTAASGADGYYVYYKTVGGKYAGYRTVKGNVTSCAVEKGKNYSYAVAPYYKSSDSSETTGALTYSVILSAPEILPKTLKNVVASSSANGLKLSWSKAAEGAKYAIYTSDSSGGKYSLAASTYDTEYTVKNSSGNKYYRIMYMKDGYQSPLSEPCSVYARSSVKALRFNTTMMKGPSWGSGAECAVYSKNSVTVTGESGNFYRCQYGKKTGYIYKRALDGGNAYTASGASAENLNAYLDDILFNTGTSPKAIWDHVHALRYNAARSDARIVNLKTLETNLDSLAVNMIKYQSGMCYHYAALSAALLDRAGYDVKLVYCPHTRSGFHCYNIVKINGNWQYFDTCRFATNADYGFLPERQNFLSVRGLNGNKEEVSDIINR